MIIDVRFFGVAYLKAWMAGNNYFYLTKDEADKHTWNTPEEKWRCFFVLDFGGTTENPFIFWTRTMANQNEFDRFKRYCRNESDELPQVYFGYQYESLIKLKKRFFDEKSIPFREMTFQEYEKKYKRWRYMRTDLPHIFDL